jgi:hypothetical protein
VSNWRENKPDDRIRQTIARLIRAQRTKQKHAVASLSDHAKNYHTRRKAAAAYKAIQLLRNDTKLRMGRTFRKWYDDEVARKRRILYNCLLHWMLTSKSGYEQCFWRWKYVAKKFGWAEVFPAHAIFFRRMFSIA